MYLNLEELATMCPYPKTKTVYWVVFTREMKFKIEKKVPDYRTS